jgi:hypothetical protein
MFAVVSRPAPVPQTLMTPRSPRKWRHIWTAAYRHKERIVLLLKYSLVSVLYYIYIFLAIYALVDMWYWNGTLAYILVYATVYLSEYVVNLRFIFHVEHRRDVFIRYIIHQIFFIVFGGMIFPALIARCGGAVFGLVATICCLFPMRFLSYRFFVYRRQEPARLDP